MHKNKLLLRAMALLLSVFLILGLGGCGESGTVDEPNSTQSEVEIPTDIDISGNVEGSPEVERKYTTLYSNHEAKTMQNPNRGYRGYAHFTNYSITPEQLRTQFANYMREHRDYVSAQVCVLYFYMPEYRGKELDERFFTLAQTAFDYAREEKFQVIVRFAYYTYGIQASNCNVNDSPTTEELILHINQIAENGLIERNKDVIHAFQVGFVGFGGEWHTESYTTSQTTDGHKKLIDAVVNVLVPKETYIQARRPIYKELVSASEERLSMIGFNHDSFTGIEDCTALGGSGFSIGLPEWDEWVKTGAYAPQDAENQFYKDSMASYGEVTEGYAALLGMSQVRMTTFSSENGYLEIGPYGDATMHVWQDLPVTEKWLKDNGIPYSENWFKNLNGETVERNVFEFIRDYLGYRFTVTKLSSKKNGENLDVSLSLENHGFSAAFNIKSNLVILDESNKVVETVEAGNPKDWHTTDPDNYSDRTQLVHTIKSSVKLPTEKGEYKLALQLISHDGTTARLDNNIEYENGFNILHTFSVK